MYWAAWGMMGVAVYILWRVTSSELWEDLGKHEDLVELYADTIQTLQDQLCEANDSADYWQARCKLLDQYNNYKGG